MKSATRFTLEFLLLGFLAKIAGEAIHEIIGHGLPVVFFGGTITRIHIAIMWPYELSSISFTPPPGGFAHWEAILVDGGGILVSVIVTSVIQAFLLTRKLSWPVSTSLFWLAFWTFINPTGYLIIGGMSPFGDVWNLINEGVIGKEGALISGLFLFLVDLFSLSAILESDLAASRIIRTTDKALVIFWLIIPLITTAMLIGSGQPLTYLLLSFLPVLLIWAYLALRKRKSDSK